MSIKVEYNPTSFYSNRSNLTPTSMECSSLNYKDASWDTKCSNSFSDNSENCYRVELCKNVKYGDKIRKIQNNHSGADDRYLDTKKQYYYEYINMVNLGVAIVGVSFITAFYFTK